MIATILTGLENFVFTNLLKVSPESLALVAVIEKYVVAHLPVARPRRTVVVLVDPDPARSSDPECSMRDQLRQIIDIARSEFGAAAVVADFTLNPARTCQTDTAGSGMADTTEKLQESAVWACTSGRSPMPVVFGYDLAPDGAPLPHVSLGPKGPSQCRMAITNTNTDWRVLQTQWPVPGDHDDTVAWAAAQLLDRNLEGEIHPISTVHAVLYMKPFSHQSYQGRIFLASDLFESSNASRPTPPPGSVWVVGSRTGEPSRYTGALNSQLLGEQPGYLRQAAYLESLLEKSYLREAPLWVTLIVVAITSWWAWLLDEERGFRTGATIVVVGTLGFVALQALLVWLGLYSAWASCSVISIFVWSGLHVKRAFEECKKWLERRLAPPLFR